MKRVFRLLLIPALVAAFAVSTAAQSSAATRCLQEAQPKKDLYEKFLANYKGTVEDQKLANELGNEYVTKYGNCPDDADAKVTQFVQRWLDRYAKAVREFACTDAINRKDYARAFPACGRLVQEQPDNLDWLLLLSRAGYANITSAAPDNSLNAEAAKMAHRAAELIETGKSPAKWDPFPSRDEALGFLYYAQGVFTHQTAPAEAAAAFIKAAQSNSLFKRESSTYTYLAAIYETNELNKLIDKYNASFPPGQPIPDAKKTQYEQMLAQINEVRDRIIDAYARAASILNPDPTADANRKVAVNNKLIAYYKTRHQGSDAGLAELIFTVMSQPIPLPSH